MKTMHEIEAELKLKAQRIGYWESFRRLPEVDELQERGEW